MLSKVFIKIIILKGRRDILKRPIPKDGPRLDMKRNYHGSQMEWNIIRTKQMSGTD